MVGSVPVGLESRAWLVCVILLASSPYLGGFGSEVASSQPGRR